MGSFERVYQPLDLGMLQGNKFSIALRFIDSEIADKDIKTNVENTINHGFINYFGM